MANMPVWKQILEGSDGTERERKKAFNRFASAVSALFNVPKQSITDVSIGVDANGTEWLYAHQRDSAVVTTVTGELPI